MRLHSAGRGSRNGQDTSRSDIRTASDLRRVLGEQIEHARINPDLDPYRRGRLIAELADVALRAIELSMLEAPDPDDSDQRPFTLKLGPPISQTPIQPSQ